VLALAGRLPVSAVNAMAAKVALPSIVVRRKLPASSMK